MLVVASSVAQIRVEVCSARHLRRTILAVGSSAALQTTRRRRRRVGSSVAQTQLPTTRVGGYSEARTRLGRPEACLETPTTTRVRLPADSLALRLPRPTPGVACSVARQPTLTLVPLADCLAPTHLETLEEDCSALHNLGPPLDRTLCLGARRRPKGRRSLATHNSSNNSSNSNKPNQARFSAILANSNSSSNNRDPVGCSAVRSVQIHWVPVRSGAIACWARQTTSSPLNLRQLLTRSKMRRRNLRSSRSG